MQTAEKLALSLFSLHLSLHLSAEKTRLGETIYLLLNLAYW